MTCPTHKRRVNKAFFGPHPRLTLHRKTSPKGKAPSRWFGCQSQTCPLCPLQSVAGVCGWLFWHGPLTWGGRDDDAMPEKWTMLASQTQETSVMHMLHDVGERRTASQRTTGGVMDGLKGISKTFLYQENKQTNTCILFYHFTMKMLLNRQNLTNSNGKKKRFQRQISDLKVGQMQQTCFLQCSPVFSSRFYR